MVVITSVIMAPSPEDVGLDGNAGKSWGKAKTIRVYCGEGRGGKMLLVCVSEARVCCSGGV